MGQEEALGRLAGDGFGSSEPACTAQCRAPASIAGSLVGSTDGDSSIDIVGLKPLKTAALRAEQEDGALQWKSSSPRNTKRRHSGGRSRFAPDFLGLHEGGEAPEDPQPASAGRETTEGLQHDINGNSSAAGGSPGTQTQQPGQGAGLSAYVDNPMQQQQQLEHGVQPGSKEMSDDEGAPMHEEGGAADRSADKDWSSLVCCVCDDGGAHRSAEPLPLLMAIRFSCRARQPLHVIFWMDRQAHDTAASAYCLGHYWQGVSLWRALLLPLYAVMKTLLLTIASLVRLHCAPSAVAWLIAGELLNCDGPCQRAFHLGIAEKKFRKGTGEEATEEVIPRSSPDNLLLSAAISHQQTRCPLLRLNAFLHSTAQPQMMAFWRCSQPCTAACAQYSERSGNGKYCSALLCQIAGMVPQALL